MDYPGHNITYIIRHNVYKHNNHSNIIIIVCELIRNVLIEKKNTVMHLRENYKHAIVITV